MIHAHSWLKILTWIYSCQSWFVILQEMCLLIRSGRIYTCSMFKLIQKEELIDCSDIKLELCIEVINLFMRNKTKTSTLKLSLRIHRNSLSFLSIQCLSQRRMKFGSKELVQISSFSLLNQWYMVFLIKSNIPEVSFINSRNQTQKQL